MPNPGYSDTVSDDAFLKGAEERAAKNQYKSADDLVMLNARVPKDLRQRLRWAALKHERSNTSIITEALEKWLSEAEEAKPDNAFEDDDI